MIYFFIGISRVKKKKETKTHVAYGIDCIAILGYAGFY